MIKIENDNGFYDNCQACHTEGNIHSITISDGRFGVELHLCKKCCEKLSKEIDRHLKNVDKIN